MNSIKRLPSGSILKTVLVLSTLFFATEGSAQVWQSANSHKVQQLSVAGFGQLYFNPTEFQAVAVATYGLIDRLQLEARAGFGSIDFQVGAYAKYQLLRDQVVDVSLWGGFSYLKVSRLEFAPIISHSLKQFTLYAASIFTIPLTSGSNVGINLAPGVSVPIMKDNVIYAEFDINLTNSANSASVGVRHFF